MCENMCVNMCVNMFVKVYVSNDDWGSVRDGHYKDLDLL